VTPNNPINSFYLHFHPFRSHIIDKEISESELPKRGVVDMKRYLKIIVAVILIAGLCGCTQSEFVNLGVFIENYCSNQDSQPLDYTSFAITSDSDGTIYNCFFEGTNPLVALRLFSDDSKNISECHVILPKLDEKGNKLNLTDEAIALFVDTAVNTTCAFTFCSLDEARQLVSEFTLDKKDTYLREGELTKEKGSFYYVYVSNPLASEFIIYNKWLHEIESTKKPESRAAYNDTTKIRDETVRLE